MSRTDRAISLAYLAIEMLNYQPEGYLKYQTPSNNSLSRVVCSLGQPCCNGSICSAIARRRTVKISNQWKETPYSVSSKAIYQTPSRERELFPLSGRVRLCLKRYQQAWSQSQRHPQRQPGLRPGPQQQVQQSQWPSPQALPRWHYRQLG